MTLAIESARRADCDLHLHLSESLYEPAECMRRHGVRPVAWYERLKAFIVETWAELKKTTWPPRREVYGTTVVVITHNAAMADMAARAPT
mgnify:CR=1 FL=1